MPKFSFLLTFSTAAAEQEGHCQVAVKACIHAVPNTSYLHCSVAAAQRTTCLALRVGALHNKTAADHGVTHLITTRANPAARKALHSDLLVMLAQPAVCFCSRAIVKACGTEGWLASLGGECTPLTRGKLRSHTESERSAVVASDAADLHVHGQGLVKDVDSQCHSHSCVFQLKTKKSNRV